MTDSSKFTINDEVYYNFHREIKKGRITWQSKTHFLFAEGLNEEKDRVFATVKELIDYEIDYWQKLKESDNYK